MAAQPVSLGDAALAAVSVGDDDNCGDFEVPAPDRDTGSVPLRKTVSVPANPPGYYSIDAQLNGGGTVTCEILVGGKVISKATASGSYEIASGEIVQDPFGGGWQDANSA